MTGWYTSRTEVDIIHVWPAGDAVGHDLDDHGECVCGPTTVLLDGGEKIGDVWQYVHHSLNKRPNGETG